jgi:hypothetical protein
MLRYAGDGLDPNGGSLIPAPTWNVEFFALHNSPASGRMQRPPKRLHMAIMLESSCRELEEGRFTDGLSEEVML